MKNVVKQTIDYYTKYLKEPNVLDIEIEDKSLLEKTSGVFVTILLNGEIRGSSGNVKPIESNIALELIKNTVVAISQDSRFKPLTLSEAEDVKIRVDIIEEETILKKGELTNLEPIKSGVLIIEKEYNKIAVILPNISNKLATGKDFIPALSSKIGEEFKEENYYIYKVGTKVI